MASTKVGHLALGAIEMVIVDETYFKELQTPFNPRFSTGEPKTGDLSFFQYITMEDWSGGSGQEVFVVNNRFNDSENIDVTKAGELKLAPLIEQLTTINGPQHDHLNRPVEDEDGWPQITEWLGQAVIFNDQTEFDGGGVEFLEVYETDVIQESVVGSDINGTGGVIANDTRATILSISNNQGLPGQSVQVKVRFFSPTMEIPNGPPFITYSPTPAQQLVNYNSGVFGQSSKYRIAFRLYFGGTAEKMATNFAEQVIEYEHAIFSFSTVTPTPPANIYGKTVTAVLNKTIDVDFTVRIPDVSPGVYKLWTDAGVSGYPFTPISYPTVPPIFANLIAPQAMADRMNVYGSDQSSNANVQFFVQSVGEVLVTRKNLYAPQLKATAVIGSKLVGGRVIDGAGHLEVYERQNEAIDRTLQVKLSDATVTPAVPTYMQFVGSNNIVIAAFDNRIYAVDILTSGLTAAQRFTFIGQVPGDYVSGMTLWNQRIYIASFSKSTFTSTISWTNGTELQGSYSIDGKFWITDIANFNGGLFYSGGRQDGRGEVRIFPSDNVIDIEHPIFDARVRSLNAGRFLYFGHSHGVGVGTITERGVSKWAITDLGQDPTNVVWDIEEVGETIFFLAGNGLYRTTPRYASFGFWESSQIGGNTPLINKIWRNVTLEVEFNSDAQRVRVYVRNSNQQDSQWTYLGVMVKDDGIQKEFIFPTDYRAQWVEIRLELETDDPEETPIVKRLLTKYVPSTLNKLQWAFSVRATDGLQMLDGKTNRSSGQDIINALWDLKNIGVAKFRDKDDQEYDVIITDMSETTPILDKIKNEAIISIELLEA